MIPHEIYLLLGSNILPEQNIRAALRLLRDYASVKAISPVWETPAVGSTGPNFLNLVVLIAAHLSKDDLKFNVLRKIEAQLGRIRTEDKNAPRPIDMDILIYGQESLEPNIGSQAHIACPLADLLPDLVDPGSGKSLAQLAQEYQRTASVRQRSDLHFEESLI